MEIQKNSLLLPFPPGMAAGRFVRREKRFSVAVRMVASDGHEQTVWAHTNNTGTMLGLIRTDAPVLLSPAQNEKRTLRWTLEAIWHDGSYPHEADLPPGHTPFAGAHGFWVGVNTSVPNRLLEKAFHAGLLPFAAGYTSLRREAVRGQSRLDGLLEGPGLPRLWVECKNVTLVEDDVALFPDAVSVRGLKHLEELDDIVRSTHGQQVERGVMLYVIQRPDGECFAPADMVDPAYARRFYELCGVEICPLVCNVSAAGYSVGNVLPVRSAFENTEKR